MIFYYIANTVERYAEKKKKKQITRGMTDNNITFYQPMINENNQLINENNNEGYNLHDYHFYSMLEAEEYFEKDSNNNLEPRNFELNIEQKKFLKNTYEGVQF